MREGSQRLRAGALHAGRSIACSLDRLCQVVEQALTLRIPAIALFPVVDASGKTAGAEEAYNPEGLVPRCVRELKRRFPEMGVITDVALDPYTSHGQDGLVNDAGYVVNDETLAVLEKQALTHAEAGADIVAPSDMMDGRIGAIRAALDARRFIHVRILAYSAKYASGFLRPVPRRGRLRDPASARATRRPTRWIRPTPTRHCTRSRSTSQEGADFVMVKPAMPYLDIVRRVKERFGVPTFVYQVSGEYAMLKGAGAQRLDRRRRMHDGGPGVLPARRRRRDPHLLRARSRAAPERNLKRHAVRNRAAPRTSARRARCSSESARGRRAVRSSSRSSTVSVTVTPSTSSWMRGTSS